MKVKIRQIEASIDHVRYTQTDDVSIDGRKGVLRKESICDVVVYWRGRWDENYVQLDMDQDDFEAAVGDLSDAVWDSKQCGQSEVDDTGEHEIVSMSFAIDGEDVSDEYDLDEVQIDYVGDSSARYESDGEANWYGITVVLDDDEEELVMFNDADALENWLQENGYIVYA